MVLVDESTFLLEMAKKFSKTRAKGSVWITIKKSPPPKKSDKPTEAKALVRCTDGKKTVGTLVAAQNVVRFQVQFASLMKSNIDNLKKSEEKKEKKEKKKPSAKTSEATPSKKKGTKKE